ncbi:MAG: hypothetical protein H7X75_06695 [Burkholderiaceae bacterium]|nr:hypothetical protein [Burkholderiaceae bacterium]
MKSIRPVFIVRLSLAGLALASLALAIFLVHTSATGPRHGTSLSGANILSNVITAASLIGAFGYARDHTRASTLRLIVGLFTFVLLVAAQLVLDAHLYLLFGGRIYT